MFPNSSKTGIYLFIKVKEVLYERDKQSLQGVVDHNGENSFHYHVDFSFRSLTSLWALMSVRCWLFVWLVSRSFCHNFLKGREVTLQHSYRSTCFLSTWQKQVWPSTSLRFATYLFQDSNQLDCDHHTDTSSITCGSWEPYLKLNKVKNEYKNRFLLTNMLPRHTSPPRPLKSYKT